MAQFESPTTKLLRGSSDFSLTDQALSGGNVKDSNSTVQKPTNYKPLQKTSSTKETTAADLSATGRGPDPASLAGRRLRSSVAASAREAVGLIQNRLNEIKAEQGRGQSGAQTEGIPSTGNEYLDRSLEARMTDRSAARDQIREDAGLAELEETARRKAERITMRDRAYQDQIDLLEKNPEGKAEWALNNDINKIERARSREIADLSIAAEIASGNFEAAQAMVDSRIQDMEDDIENEIEMWEKAYEFANPAMSEAEQLASKQAHDIRMLELRNTYDKELISYREQFSSSGSGSSNREIDLSPTQERDLVGVGLDASQISNIQSDVSEFGVQAVIDGLDTDEQKKLVAEIYGYSLPKEPLTKETVKTKAASALTSYKSLGYDRDTARDTIANRILSQLADQGLTTLPPVFEDAIDDAVTEVYGATFWQGLFGG